MGTAVICIDMQKDFCLPDAPLFVKESPVSIPKCKQLIEGARQHNLPIVWVIREHEPDGVDVEHTRQHLYQDGKGPTLRGSAGAQIVEELQPLQDEIVIVKKRFSAFFNTSLDSILRRKGIRHLIVCGVQTPNCIRACAYDGICLDYNVTVSSDATASASPAVQQANLHDMANVGIKIATTQEIVDDMS
eukprot:jgi/Ulvmu1/2656/UM014_0110.1